MSRGRRVARKSVHIDALRGVAILAVVQYHYGSTSKLYRKGRSANDWRKALARSASPESISFSCSRPSC
jgi:peptidoglycan/LPS O-acetylase OafA/YrhL